MRGNILDRRAVEGNTALDSGAPLGVGRDIEYDSDLEERRAMQVEDEKRKLAADPGGYTQPSAGAAGAGRFNPLKGVAALASDEDRASAQAQAEEYSGDPDVIVGSATDPMGGALDEEIGSTASDSVEENNNKEPDLITTASAVAQSSAPDATPAEQDAAAIDIMAALFGEEEAPATQTKQFEGDKPSWLGVILSGLTTAAGVALDSPSMVAAGGGAATSYANTYDSMRKSLSDEQRAARMDDAKSDREKSLNKSKSKAEFENMLKLDKAKKIMDKQDWAGKLSTMKKLGLADNVVKTLDAYHQMGYTVKESFAEMSGKSGDKDKPKRAGSELAYKSYLANYETMKGDEALVKRYLAQTGNPEKADAAMQADAWNAANMDVESANVATGATSGKKKATLAGALDAGNIPSADDRQSK
ncbi:MAG: hypothetical protein DRN30_03100, partial [Thermoplasmata archaeon]